MMNARDRGLKESLWAKFKDCTCAKLCSKLWFKSDWYFSSITESVSWLKGLPRTKVPNNHFLKSGWKRKSIAEHWTVISDQMINQLPHARLDQINDLKHDIYFYGKLSTKLLAPAPNKNTKFMFTKSGRLLFPWLQAPICLLKR